MDSPTAFSPSNEHSNSDKPLPHDPRYDRQAAVVDAGGLIFNAKADSAGEANMRELGFANRSRGILDAEAA